MLVLGLGLANGELGAQESPTPREAWIASQMVALRRYQKGSTTPPVSVSKDVAEEPDDAGCTHRYYADRDGLLRFASGETVWVATNSFHAHDGVGDVLLILTSTGKFYVNAGHAGPHMIVRSKAKVLSLADFLNTLGIGEDPKKLRWKQWPTKSPSGEKKHANLGAK